MPLNVRHAPGMQVRPQSGEPVAGPQRTIFGRGGEGQVRDDRVEAARRLQDVAGVGHRDLDPRVVEAGRVVRPELGAGQGDHVGVEVDDADRPDGLMPEQLPDRQAVSAPQHEHVQRPVEPRRAATSAGWTSLSW